MKAIKQHIHGKVIEHNNHTMVWLQNAKPDTTTADSLYLRFAFVTLGREEHIFPAFLLDDWGKEIRGTAVYQWVHQFGSQFPRAEIFGFDRNGNETQLFVRELELYFKLPCYLYHDLTTPLAEGKLVNAIAITQPEITEPTAKRPSQLSRPLRSAAVQWWQLPVSFNPQETPLPPLT